MSHQTHRTSIRLPQRLPKRCPRTFASRLAISESSTPPPGVVLRRVDTRRHCEMTASKRSHFNSSRDSFRETPRNTRWETNRTHPTQASRAPLPVWRGHRPSLVVTRRGTHVALSVPQPATGRDHVARLWEKCETGKHAAHPRDVRQRYAFVTTWFVSIISS